MYQNSEFLNQIKNISNPEIEEEINTRDPYAICDLLESTKGGPNGIYLKRLEDAIISTNDIVQIYEFMFLAVDMNVIGFDRERFERIIRESKNPKLMCYCMGFVPGTNIELMLKALENVQNAKYMDMLIINEEYEGVYKKIKGINPKYEETVENAKKFDYYPDSLKQFKHLKDDITSLKKQIIDTKNAHLITELANYIEYLNEYKDGYYDIEDLITAQEEVKDPMQAYEFLASVNVENKTRLIQIVIKFGKVKFMYYVYAYVTGLTEEERNELKESIIETDQGGKYKKIIEDEIEKDEISTEL